jgi:signal transduction histidine kinase
MAGITAAPTVRCITISPMTAEVVVARASGSASDAASAASAMVVQRSRACGVRRSRRASSSQPNSEAATVTPMTWPIAIVWMWPARAEQAREEETRRRVDAERMRIARELHDVVAHSMAMINVQATAASMQLAADPASAAEAIQAIRRASKSGLRELRTILEVLRQVDGGTPSVPVPYLRAIAALVEATTAAGTPTTLELAEPPAPLPPPVTLAIYRIVQESLTNVEPADRQDPRQPDDG